MWPQVQEAKEENRHELLICGKDLTKEILTSNGLLDIAIFDLHQLNFLRLANSASLSSLPDEIGNLKNLTNLELQGNSLSALPKSIGELRKLKLLDVSENKLKRLPKEMNQLLSLTTLNARKNELDELVSFENCTLLLVVDIRMNKLTTFKEICHEKLSSVTELQASSNEISEIPKEIHHLSNLKNLNLSENLIREIPSELLHCTKLKEINLKGNCLSDRRFKKLVESDRGFSRTVLDYLKQNLKPAKGKPDSGKNKKKNKLLQKEPNDINEVCDRLSVLLAKETFAVHLTADVKDIRGVIVCCILRNIDLTGSKLKTFLSIQNKLHETACGKRVLATIATHDLAKVVGPLCYCAKPPDQILIRPLNKGSKVSAKDFFRSLQEDAESIRKQMKRKTYSGIHKYLNLVECLEKWPCLVDSKGTVISFPPITNADDTKIENETTDIFVEVTTNISLKKGKDVMEELILATLEGDLSRDTTENGKKLLVVEQVRIFDEGEKLKLVFPSKTDLILNEDSKVCVVRS